MSGFKLLMEVFNVLPGSVSRGVDLMKHGHLLAIAPGIVKFMEFDRTANIDSNLLNDITLMRIITLNYKQLCNLIFIYKSRPFSVSQISIDTDSVFNVIVIDIPIYPCLLHLTPTNSIVMSL